MRILIYNSIFAIFPSSLDFPFMKRLNQRRPRLDLKIIFGKLKKKSLPKNILVLTGQK